MAQPHATVNTSSFQGKATVQGRWTRRFSRRQRERRDHYERRRPEDTTLHQLVQEHLETFLAQVKLETGAGLPDFVKEGVQCLSRMRRTSPWFPAPALRRLCAHEKLVAFCCKRRGFCPACGARCMAETVAHLVDYVIPRVKVASVGVIVSDPAALSLFASHPHLLAPVLQIIHRVISTFLIQQAGLKRTEADTGAVTLIQRFGSAANLNIHLHCLVLDGVYRTTEGVPSGVPCRARPHRRAADPQVSWVLTGGPPVSAIRSSPALQ